MNEKERGSKGRRGTGGTEREKIYMHTEQRLALVLRKRIAIGNHLVRLTLPFEPRLENCRTHIQARTHRYNS
jgi:hypothetical protein